MDIQTDPRGAFSDQFGCTALVRELAGHLPRGAARGLSNILNSRFFFYDRGNCHRQSDRGRTVRLNRFVDFHVNHNQVIRNFTELQSLNDGASA